MSSSHVLAGGGSCPGGGKRGFHILKRLSIFHSQIAKSSRNHSLIIKMLPIEY